MPFVQQQLVQAQQDCAAVDATGKRNADGRRRVLYGEPVPQLVIDGLDVVTSDEIEIR